MVLICLSTFLSYADRRCRFQYTIPDNTIEITSDFKNKILKGRTKIFKKILGRDNLNGITKINIDYTIARDIKTVLTKLWKSYQSGNRLLLIVLVGPLSTTDLNNIRNAVNSFKPSSGVGSQWIDNVNVISFNEYRELFGIEDSFIEKCNAILGFDKGVTIKDVISDILNNLPPVRNAYMDRLLELHDRGQFLLNNWNQKLLTEFK